jgi:ABC-type polysaccharide/polyol phosphate transport system ATPase subunit
MPNAIEAEGLSKSYRLGEDHSGASLRDALVASWQRVARVRRRAPRQEIWSLRDVNLTVAEGEAVGVIGRNGAGKSTLLKILSRITEPTSGVVRTRGRVASLLEVGTGFHPELTGRENVYLNGAILGMRRGEVERRFEEIVAFAGVERFIDTPVKRYSTGMYLRLAFSVAAHLDPDILLVDEVLAVGDAEFQAKCLQRMEGASGQGRTVVFVSHNLGVVSRLCQRAYWLDRGRVQEAGPSVDVVEAYVRTQALTGVDRWSGHVAGPVAVHAVLVTDEAGRPVEILQRDQAVVIEVRYSLDAPVPGFDLAVFVQRAGGAEVLGESWADTAADRVGEPGRYVARLRIPPVLNVGEYVVDLWMGDPYETYIHERTVQHFRLIGDAQNRPDRAVILRLPWDVERAGGLEAVDQGSHDAQRERRAGDRVRPDVPSDPKP